MALVAEMMRGKFPGKVFIVLALWEILLPELPVRIPMAVLADFRGVHTLAEAVLTEVMSFVVLMDNVLIVIFAPGMMDPRRQLGNVMVRVAIMGIGK